MVTAKTQHNLKNAQEYFEEHLCVSLTKIGFQKVFPTMEQWGVAGIKVDFMNSDSQETVKWHENVLKAAAQHRLMVDFHGAYKPTGLARTYPNYIT